jgi:hypothetical protein
VAAEFLQERRRAHRTARSASWIVVAAAWCSNATLFSGSTITLTAAGKASPTLSVEAAAHNSVRSTSHRPTFAFATVSAVGAVGALPAAQVAAPERWMQAVEPPAYQPARALAVAGVPRRHLLAANSPPPRPRKSR